jgi:SAM-dependent methyltransferase
MKMKFVKLDPPGTWCLHHALFEMLKDIKGNRFIEFGCGDGSVSLKLLEKGYSGVGIDFSPIAIERASSQLSSYVNKGAYQLMLMDIFDTVELDKHIDRNFDIAISLFVMEHVENDIAFLKQLKSRLRPGGSVIIAVPGRKDKWSLEDETAGHLRRYERNELFNVLKKAGLTNIEVWSIAVPVGNWLFSLSDFIVKMSSEKEKLNVSLKEQTQAGYETFHLKQYSRYSLNCS